MSAPFDPGELAGALDVAVYEERDGRLALAGRRPAWLERLEAAEGVFPLGSAFLSDWLREARAAWRDGRRAESGAWTELDCDGRPVALEATALSARDGRPLLVVERLGARHEESARVLQRARETVIERDALERAERRLAGLLNELERSHATLLALLDRLGVGVALCDASGRPTFVSATARRWLGLSDELPPDVRALFARVRGELGALEEAVARADSSPVAVELEGAGARFLEVRVERDPRDERRRLLSLSDRTAERELRQALDGRARFGDLVGKSPAMRAVFRAIAELAPYTTTVLVEGETGTGKELVARALHGESPRRGGPFVALNCAGLAETLLEAQLFGHRRGAFTGALEDRPGLVEAAQGGTLFLDEIGDVPAAVQTRLLRVLQEREVVRVGETRPRKVDVRFVAATHRDLAEEVRAGRFRQDLFYRVRVARIRLPALAERREDVPLLARAFLERLSAELGKSVRSLAPEALDLCLAYDWPGNVRELRSALEVALVRARGDVIQPGDLPPEILELAPPAPEEGAGQRERVLEALKRAGGNRTQAARLLGIGRATLYRWLERLELGGGQAEP